MIEDLLLDFVAYGFRGGPLARITRVRLYGGRERRNSDVTRRQWRYTLPYDRIKPEHYQQIEDAFLCADGDTFRIRVPLDNQLDNVVIGTAVGGGESMQIIKPSAFGAATYDRVIRKPADSTVFTIANGYETDATPLAVTEDTGGGPSPLAFSCDYTTGILTFTATAGAIIRVTGEFHVPVFFDHDDLEFTLQTFRAHTGDVRLLEDLGV